MLKLSRIIDVVVIALVCNVLHNAAVHAGTFGDECAEVLEDVTTCTIKSYAKPKVAVKKRIRIYREEGDRYGEILLHESGMIKLKSFFGRIIDASNEVIYTCDKNDGKKYCGFSGNDLYADVCDWRYTLTSNRYPYTIEYEYLLEPKSPLFTRDWLPQWDIPVLSSAYHLILPNNMPMHWRSIGNIPQPEMTEEKGYLHYHWQLTDVPAFQAEDYAVNDEEQRMGIQTAPQTLKLGTYTLDAADWPALSGSMYRLYEDKMELAASQETLVRNTLGDGDPARANIQRLHEMLAAQMRYVAIEIGIGGWEPSPATETFTRSYGDCKDLSVLYTSILSAGGIPTTCALITRGSRNAVDPQIPQLHFNHAIFLSIVGDDTVWVDPTCQECAVGDLPWDDEDRYALILDPQNGNLVRTPRSTAAENTVSRRVLLFPDENMQGAARIIFTNKGNESHWLQSALRRSKQSNTEEVLKNGLFGLSRSFVLDSHTLLENTIGQSSITIQVRGISPETVRPIGDEFYLNFGWLSLLRKQESINLQERKNPIELQSPLSISDTIIIDLPEVMKIVKMPDDVEFADEFGNLSIRYYAEGQRITIIRERKSDLYQVLPNDFERYRQFIKEITKLTNQYIIIARSV